MVSKTISQRISLEGGEEFRKKLEEIGTTGEKSFKQIATAGQNAKIDPQQFDQVKQALDNLATAGSQLGQQLQQLGQASASFGTAGTQAAQQVTTELQQTGNATQQTATGFKSAAAEANNLGIRIGIVAGITEAATSKLLGFVNTLRAALTPGALLKGVVDTGNAIHDQADELNLSVEAWLKLRQALSETSVSTDDAKTALEKLTTTIDDAKGGIGRLGASTQQIVTFADGTAVSIIKFNNALANTKGKSNEAMTELLRLGVPLKTIASGNTLAILQAVAENINRIRDATKRASEGSKQFGDDWKEIIKALLATKQPIDETGKSLAELGKLHRDISADQVKQAHDIKEAWDDFGKAIRALKDQLGTLFLGGELKRAEWLTNLIDGTTELLRMFRTLDAEKRKTFMEGLGETAAENLFKVLITAGTVLAGIWQDILVPAGKQLGEILSSIGASLGGLSTGQVLGFFVALAIAAGALAIALKGIGFVLAPLGLLLSTVFSPLGLVLIPLIALVVLFWDTIKEGAQQVAALIPGELAQIGAAFTKLFQGDFSGFWKDFSTAAVSAFQKIWQAILQTEGIFGDFARAISGEGVVKTPWVQQLVDGIKEIGKSIPGTIQLIITALIGLGQAASGVANIMNRLFGTELTGTDVAAIAIIGQMTGGLQALSSVAVIAGAAITTLISIIVAIAPAIAGAIGISAGALVAIIFGVIAALIALIAIWPQLKADAVATWEQIKAKAAEVMQLIQDWVLTPVASAWQWIVDTFNSIVGQIAPKVQELKNGLIELVTTPIASAWQWITDTFNAAIDAILGKLASAIAAIKSALAAATSGSGIDMGGGSGGTPGLASGGQVGGRGTGTSDSNLARVSRGEYITPAAAVRQPGVLAFLEALRRSGGDLRNAIERMGHFALGGLVLPPPVAIPAFAGGGMSHVTIQFPGLPDIVGLRASSNVVGELRKAAAMAQVRSGGRKPSRYG